METKGKVSKWSWVSLSLSAILGLITLIVGGPLWKAFGVPENLWAEDSTALAVVLLVLGLAFAILLQQSEFHATVLREQKQELSQAINSMPLMEVFTAWSGEAAMAKLIGILPSMHSVMNTRVLSSEMAMATHPTQSPWDESVREFVRSGKTFREVISDGNIQFARNRLRAASGGDGVYEAVSIPNQLPSFLNFIVLERGDGAREVWFGWIVSRAAGFETSVFRTSEPRIVEMFVRWHRELFVSGQLVGLNTSDAGSVSVP